MQTNPLESWEKMLREGAYEALLQQSKGLASGNSDLQGLRAMATARLRRLPEALSMFNDLLDAYPDRAEWLSERAVVYLHLKKKTLCLLDFNRAQALEPQNPYRFASRAYAKEHFGDLAGAIQDYEKALELDPEDAVAHNNLGLLQEKLGYRQKAQKHMQQADVLAGMLSDWEKQLPVEVDEPKAPPTKSNKNQLWKEIWRVLTHAEGRKEFLKWLRNRFA